jgi:hypothetical protein
MSSSVKSTAGAIKTIPTIDAALERSDTALANSNASHPPIEDPTSTCGPRAN